MRPGSRRLFFDLLDDAGGGGSRLCDTDVSVRRQSTAGPDGFRAWPRWVRVVLGLAVCSVGAVYLDLLAVSMTGVWRNDLTHYIDNLILATPLAAANGIGVLARRLGLANGVLAGLLLTYSVAMFCLTRSIKELPATYPIAMSVVILPLANWQLFLRWHRALDS